MLITNLYAYKYTTLEIWEERQPKKPASVGF